MGHVLHDEDLAHAIVDRVLERGRFLTLDGPSMRTKHLGLDDPTSPQASHQLARTSEGEVIRISGRALKQGLNLRTTIGIGKISPIWRARIICFRSAK